MARGVGSRMLDKAPTEVNARLDGSIDCADSCQSDLKALRGCDRLEPALERGCGVR